MEDVSIKFINKGDLSDSLIRENYSKNVLNTMSPLEFNIERSYAYIGNELHVKEQDLPITIIY